MKHILIGRGKVDWHSKGISNGNWCSSSGGTLESYLKEADDGTRIYDAKEADYDSFASFVIKGPMVDPTLEPGQVSRFNEKKTILGMLPGLGGDFKTLGMMALADVCSLDFVAPDVYVQMLQEKVPGVKFGKVINHQIVWD